MADNRKSPDEHQSEPRAPEVDTEVVDSGGATSMNTPADETRDTSENVGAGHDRPGHRDHAHDDHGHDGHEHDDHGHSVHAHGEKGHDGDASTRSPGMILFLFFVLAALGVFAVFRLTYRDGDAPRPLAQAPRAASAPASDDLSPDAPPAFTAPAEDAAAEVQTAPTATATTASPEQADLSSVDAAGSVAPVDAPDTDALTSNEIAEGEAAPSAEALADAAADAVTDAAAAAESAASDVQSAVASAVESVAEQFADAVSDAAETLMPEPEIADTNADVISGAAQPESASSFVPDGIAGTVASTADSASETAAASDALTAGSETADAGDETELLDTITDIEGPVAADVEAGVEAETESLVESFANAVIPDAEVPGAADPSAAATDMEAETPDAASPAPAASGADEAAAVVIALPESSDANADIATAESEAEPDTASNDGLDTTTIIPGTDVSSADETINPGGAAAALPDVAAAGASKIANPLSADAGIIVSEIEALKEELRAETDALSAAVSEGRQLTEQQSTRITELRESLEQAIAERDQRANAELTDLREQLAKIQSGGTEIPAGRRAAASLALLSLQRAVDAGDPYQDELETLARLAPEGEVVSRLRAGAAEGVPTLAELKAQFEPAVRRALAAPAGGAKTGGAGFLSRLGELVSVRPATPQPGDEPENVISRAEDRLNKDDLAAAVAELDALQGGSAEAFAEWSRSARARLEATQAIAELNAALLSEYRD